MNVMLSRSKKGLIVVSNKVFLSGPGCNTLVGKLARHWEQQSQSKIWLSRKEILSYDAALPGFDAKLSPAASNNLRYIPKPSVIRSVHMYTPTEEEKSVQPDARQFPQFGSSGTKVTVSEKFKETTRSYIQVVKSTAPPRAPVKKAAPERKNASPIPDWRNEYKSRRDEQSWESLASEELVNDGFIPVGPSGRAPPVRTSFSSVAKEQMRTATELYFGSIRQSFSFTPPAPMNTSPTDYNYFWPADQQDEQSWTSEESPYDSIPIPSFSRRARQAPPPDASDERAWPSLSGWPAYTPATVPAKPTPPQPFIRTLNARKVDDSARVPKVQKKPKKAAAPVPMPAPAASQDVYDPVWPSPEDAGLVNLGGFKVKSAKKDSPVVTTKVVEKPKVGKKMKITFVPMGDKRQARSYEWHSKRSL